MLKNMAHLITNPGNHSELASQFTDLHPPLNARQALIESQRCLYCYDAPCIRACPTEINVPSFIAFLAQENPNSAARTIYEQNILGGSCSRVCPTEILCEHACVRNHDVEAQPIKIGQLQRYALDHANFLHHPFQRAAATGYKVAVIGAGPAGLACAHKLSMLGNQVEIFEAENKAGGLNEYGIAKYKLTDDFAQKEVQFLLELGGIQIHHGQRLGKTIFLKDLLQQFDAVFLGIGLGAPHQLGLMEEESPGMIAAVEYIKELRQSDNLTQLPIPKHCIILGAGNTAIDMAIQIKRLGAEQVSLVYRRGESTMSATQYEQDLAKAHQVQFITWAQPVKINLNAHRQVCGMQFEKTHLLGGKLLGTGITFDIQAQAIFKAIGQTLDNSCVDPCMQSLKMEQGKIWVDGQFQTSLPKLYAGGDCIMKGEDLTVQAVQHGKLAALAMHYTMQEKKETHHG